MTPQEMIDVIQAHADGKKLQWTNKRGNTWLDCDEPTPQFAFNICDYRIKPPALRPHYPVPVLMLNGTYSISRELFTSDGISKHTNIISFVRLATEYPPVMLP